jgi:transposase
MSRSTQDKKLVKVGASESLPDGRNEVMVEDKPKRRSFDAKYKRKILEKLDECKAVRGAIGELLRREGLYAAQVAKWRAEADEANSAAFKKKRGPKPNAEAKAEKRVAELERINAQLTEQLRQAEVVIEVQKKISEILGVKQPPEADWKSGSK